MNISTIIFYTIATFILATALLAVTSLKIFRSAIWLLFSLVGIAALYFWMQLEFIAAIQIVVYVGGIVVLIIFSIFLTQESGKEMVKPNTSKIIFSSLAALLGAGFTFNMIQHYGFATLSAQPFNTNINEIGTQMLSTSAYGYILPFEVVSILLLAAMVGCIVIAMKPSAGSVISLPKKEN
jgi:NADH-quinone oxidoreductase subunit J